jgi:antitoxin ParD1/3/4
VTVSAQASSGTELIEEGMASGPGRRRTKSDHKELLAIARGEID